MPFSAIRWGLCCQFLDAPIRFRTATHRYVSGLSRGKARTYLRQIARDNAVALAEAVEHCHAHGIGAFRINSQVLPLATHPVSGYRLEQIDPKGEIHALFQAAGERARALDIRLSFHPDQFVVLNSVNPGVVTASQREIEHQAGVARLVGADTIVVHGGGAVGGVEAAVARLGRGIEGLSGEARALLALENDDRSFGPADLAPLCLSMGIRFVYDVHHHRCLPDAMTVSDATSLLRASWGAREPYAHISSPRDGWAGSNPRAHALRVDPADVPAEWAGLRMTVDVEAKEKDRAVLALIRHAATASKPRSPRSPRAPRPEARSSAPPRSRTTR